MDRINEEKIKATIRSLMELGFTEIYIDSQKTSIEERKTQEKTVQQPKKDKKTLLLELYDRMQRESRCTLYEGSSGYVFGEGNPESQVVFIGEAPGEEEDRQKRPFVGKAGQYLNQKLAQFGISRQDVYITNVVKSRPPGNRKPTKEEMMRCIPYLLKEIEIINPKLIVCLGATAYEGIFGKSAQITKIRGKVLSYPFNPKIKVLVTYHPAYVLRNPSADAEFTEDMRLGISLISSQE